MLILTAVRFLAQYSVTPLTLLACVALFSLLFVGCHDDHQDDAVAIDAPTEWVWVGDNFLLDHDDPTFTWNSSLTGVFRVEFKGHPFEGSFRVEVFDGSGARVFDEIFHSGGAVDIRESKFSAPAVAGTWVIKLDYRDLTGDVRIIIDDRL